MRTACRRAQSLVCFYWTTFKITSSTSINMQEQESKMESTETPMNPADSTAEVPKPMLPREDIRTASVSSQQSAPAPVPCPTCGSGPVSQTPSYIYAVGRIDPRFPSPSVEKEFAQ